MITAINILDGSTLGNNLVTSCQVDYLSSAIIPAEAAEINQEYLIANKVGSTTSLVS